MNIKTIFLGTVALSMLGGVALAQTSALDDPAKMEPFYTDSTMATMKSDDDFKAAWMAMTEDDRAMMSKECGDAAIAPSHNNFCEKTKQLGGAN